MDEHLTPSPSDPVHYRSRGSADGVFAPACRAAIVTEVKTPFCVSLAVLNPTGLFFDQDVTHGESLTGGTWHWAGPNGICSAGPVHPALAEVPD